MTRGEKFSHSLRRITTTTGKARKTLHDIDVEINSCACELVPARRNSGVLGPLLDTLGHLLFCRFSIDRCSKLLSPKHHLSNTV